MRAVLRGGDKVPDLRGRGSPSLGRQLQAAPGRGDRGAAGGLAGIARPCPGRHRRCRSRSTTPGAWTSPMSRRCACNATTRASTRFPHPLTSPRERNTPRFVAAAAVGHSERAAPGHRRRDAGPGRRGGIRRSGPAAGDEMSDFRSTARLVRRQRPPRPALAASAHALPRVAVGSDAADQVAGVVVPLLRALRSPRCPTCALADASVDEVSGCGPGSVTTPARATCTPRRSCASNATVANCRRFIALVAPPGIGRSTAGAIPRRPEEPQPSLDGNVKCVKCRVHGIDGWPGMPAVEKRLWGHRVWRVCDARPLPTTPRRRWISRPCAPSADPACVLCPLQGECVVPREDCGARVPTPKPVKTAAGNATRWCSCCATRATGALQRRPASRRLGRGRRCRSQNHAGAGLV